MLLFVLMLSGCATIPWVYPSTPTQPSKKAQVDDKSTTTVIGSGRTSTTIEATSQEPLAPLSNESEITTAPLCHQKSSAHVALILPLNAPNFAPMAKVLQQGFLAAYNTDASSRGMRATLPIKTYTLGVEDLEITPTYNQAIEAGACAVVGPMTKDGVNALVSKTRVTVPTLALNNIETPTSGLLLGFGLSIENEAKQVARLMYSHHINKVILVNQGSSLSRRIQHSFEEEWRRIGGWVEDVISFTGNRDEFTNLQKDGETAIFLAADAKKGRFIRPYLPKNIPVYGTSLLYNGEQNAMVSYDLEDVIFVDMPWLLQVDHPATMIYPRSEPPLSTTKERFYAIGIDSYRLVSLMLQGTATPSKQAILDGVSGQIFLSGNNFEREASAAIFAQGGLQLLGKDEVPFMH